MEVDVGVLQENADVQEPANNAAASNIEPQRSSRFAVHQALKDVTFVGNSCFGGKADGTMALPALPILPGLHVKSVGKLPLPITRDQAKSLKDPSVSCSINDDVFTKVWQIESEEVKTTNPEWDVSLRKLLDILASKLGINPIHLSADLESLLYMENESSIDWCSNREENCHKVGTLLVQLPSSFTGGSFQIYDGQDKEGQDEEEDESKTSNFDLGEITGEHEFKCHVLCHYTDCQYKMEMIRSGYRLLLCYSLNFTEGSGQLPSAAVLTTSKIPLQQSLDALPRHDRIILFPLANDYSDSALGNDGLSALSHAHRAKAEAIKAAGKDWKILIVQAKKTSCACGSCRKTSSSIVRVYDEHGRGADKHWLEKILSFAPIEEAIATTQEFSDYEGYDYYGYSHPHIMKIDNENPKHRAAMVLTDSRIIQDNWGAPNFSGENEVLQMIYTSTYLLAYDSSAEFELRCLTGREGVSNAIRHSIVPALDCALLDRLLTVVEETQHCEIIASNSRLLLEMLLKSYQKSSIVISLIQRLLLCSPSIEPDEDLWDSILLVIKKFRWETLSKSITPLLCDPERKKISHDVGARIRSRISLIVFLNRVEFAMKLTRIGSQAAAEFGEQCVTTAISDLLATDNTNVSFMKSTAYVIAKMHRIFTEYNWNGHLVYSALGFWIKHSTSNQLIDIGELLFRLHGLHDTNHCEATQDCLLTYVRKFANCPHRLLPYVFPPPKHLALLQSIRAVIDHGSLEDKDKFGARCISEKAYFSFVLDTITGGLAYGDQVNLLLDLMNQCLVQHQTLSSPSNGWKSSDCDFTSHEHIKMCFERFPNLASLADAAGRLPIHHVVSVRAISTKKEDSNSIPLPIYRSSGILLPYYSSSESDSSDSDDEDDKKRVNTPEQIEAMNEMLEFIMAKNPAAAITRDPISKMYPFMIAGSVGNAVGAFRLLVAGPDLVSGGIEVANDEELSRSSNESHFAMTREDDYILSDSAKGSMAEFQSSDSPMRKKAKTSEQATVWFMERVCVQLKQNNAEAVIKKINGSMALIELGDKTTRTVRNEDISIVAPQEHDMVLVTGGADVGMEGELVCIDGTDAIILNDSRDNFKIVDFVHLAKISATL